MPRKHRPSAVKANNQDTAVALSDVMGDFAPPEAVEEVQRPISHSPDPPISTVDVGPDPESLTDPETHAYLKRQVNLELYGKEAPNEHDKELLSIKERLQWLNRK